MTTYVDIINGAAKELDKKEVISSGVIASLILLTCGLWCAELKSEESITSFTLLANETCYLGRR